MNVVSYLAGALTTGSVSGFGPGSSIEDADRVLGDGFVESTYGNKGSKLLTRDYGLLEVTFGDPESWTCRWVIIELHRLATNHKSGQKLQKRLGLKFEPYLPWGDLKDEIERNNPGIHVASEGSLGEYEKWLVENSTKSVQVIADPAYERGDFPGIGDVWSIHLEQMRP